MCKVHSAHVSENLHVLLIVNYTVDLNVIVYCGQFKKDVKRK